MSNTTMMPVGTVLQGKYRIEKQLSSGGFGNTYKAVVVATGSTVAVKEFFLKGVTERDTTTQMVSVSNITNYDTFVQQREKFRKESRRMSELHNPHIVAVHDSFEENGTAYYVMDYIDGESLSEKLRRTGKPLTEEEVRNILAQILDALHYVHKNKLWHLDVKPGNIMVDSTGRARLIDFGASKQIDQTTGGATAKTAVTFTSGYAPREQIEQSYKKFGPWTDIYALGATLYCLLNNKRPPVPSEIDEDQTTDKHNVLPFPNGISQELRNLIVWMMTPSRSNRPQNVFVVADYLHIQLPSEEEETDVAGAELQDDDIEVEVAEVEEGTELLDAQAESEPHDEPEENPEYEDDEEEEEYDDGDDEEEAYGEEKDAGSEQSSDLAELLFNPLFKLFIVILFLVLFFLLVNGYFTN
ncbi:MAG: serine/threonine protein kinase [Prevotella sp.]|nr:serine/threonine protein kinase [Prevotella sp.]